MVKKTNPMVKKANPNTEDCECVFFVNENGVPIVECPTNEAQAMAFAALQRNPDVSIRVAAIAPAFIEDDGGDNPEPRVVEEFAEDDLDDFGDESEDLDDLEN